MQPFAEWFVQLIEMIQNIGVIIAAAITSGTAVFALSTWRKELKGKTQYAISQRLYVLAREFGHELFRAQQGFLYPSEWEKRPIKPGESDAQTNVQNGKFAFLLRAEKLNEPLHKLREASWEAELVLGLDGAQIIEPFERARSQFITSIFLYHHDQLLRLESASHTSLLSADEARLHESNVRGWDDNTVTGRVREAAASLKKSLFPYTN